MTKLKLPIALVAFLIFSIYIAKAQVYPYSIDFNSPSCPTGCCPTGWTCYTTPGFLVYPIHGTAGSQGLTKQMTTFGIVADSVSSPLVGPLTSTSEFSFDYRIMETNLYPAFAHTLTPGEKIEFYAVSGPLSQLLATVDLSNHVTSTSLTNVVFPMGALAGNSGNLKIKVTKTNSDFFADFDNFSINNASGIFETNKPNDRAFVFPNPSANGTVLKLKGVPPGLYQVKLVSSAGIVNLMGDITVDSKESNLINSGSLNRGMYMLQLIGVRNNYLIKFVVKD